MTESILNGDYLWLNIGFFKKNLMYHKEFGCVCGIVEYLFLKLFQEKIFYLLFLQLYSNFLFN